MKPARPLSLKVKALQWLAQREYSRAELGQRLRRLAEQAGQDAAEVEPLLAWLQARRYLSDARFVESRVQVRGARFGNRRIEAELRQHGVVLDNAARQQLASTELERARALWQRKYGAPAADLAGRLRQMRFLAGRGFSAEVVRRVVQADDELG